MYEQIEKNRMYFKSINNALMKKLISSQVDKIYLALDNDAIKNLTSLDQVTF